MPGHNWLFARQFPIAYSCSRYVVIPGFYRRRYDLLAINQLASQSQVRFLLMVIPSPSQCASSGHSPIGVIICLALHHYLVTTRPIKV